MRIWNILLVILALFPLGGRSAERAASSASIRYDFSEKHMGVDFRIVLFADSENHAREASQAAFKRVAALNDLLSDYDAESEVRRISVTGGSDQWVKVSRDLHHVLSFSNDLFLKTDGAFDPTVGPYVLAWRQARFRKAVPPAEKLARMREVVGFEKVLIRRGEIQLTQTRMRLDLGACAKGYAVDEALREIRNKGITSALVDGGGDIALGDPPPNKEGWRIEVEAADQPFLMLFNCAVATSGDAYQFLEIDGVRYSHIVDPRTGMGVTHQSQLTVVAKDALHADGWASALSVMGSSDPLTEQLVRDESLKVYWVKRK